MISDALIENLRRKSPLINQPVMRRLSTKRSPLSGRANPNLGNLIMGGSAGAAPIGAPRSLQDAAGSTAQTVQWPGGGRTRGDHAAGPVAGAIIDGTVAASPPSAGCDDRY